MYKNLQTKIMLLLAMILGGMNVYAQTADVSYDFTEEGWTVSDGTLSKGTVSFTGEGATFKMNDGYFFMGKSGAYINFPTYSQAVSKIVVTGKSGASGSVKMNMFVGETAVSTETTGATGTNSYEIASNYQAAGTQYTLKVTSAHNTQITKIEVYYAEGGSDTPDDPTPVDPTPSTDGTWEATDLANLTSTDVFVIVGNNGSNFAMSNANGTGSAPSAVAVTVADNKITSEVTDAIKWNISGDATNGYTFYPNGSTTTWLYCTNTNNGVRVGTNTDKTFKINEGYLKHDGTSRYVGIYNSQDWRCYTSTGGNIANQAFAFYKYVASDDNRQEAGLAWSASTVDVNIFAEENDYTLPTLTNPNNVTVSYSSTNEDVAVIDAESGDILLETGAVGSAVIKATFAGDDRYKPAEVSYTINIVDNREVPTFAWSESTVEIDLGATEYTLPTLTKPEGATVTYSSSDDEVALVDENTGEVVVETSAVGTATITATFEGNDTYKPATASYTINIIDPNAADGSEQRPYSVADVIEMNPTSTSEAVKTGVYVKGFIIGAVDGSTGALKSVAESNSVDTNLAIADSPTETDNYCTVQLPSGDIRNALKTKNQIYNIGVAQVLVKGNIKKYCNKPGVRDVSEGSKIAEQVSISPAGMSTYYTDCALDFTGNEKIYAYTVTDGTNKVTYNKVDVVPANTAVVLRSVNEGAASELIPVSESTAKANSALEGTLEDKYVTTGYVLNNGSNGVGFYKANPEANDGQGTKIAAHRAYLPATSGAKDFIGIDFDSVATAISAIETETETNNVYDLQGRKVTNPAKGLYIVNGKKVVIK